SAWVFTELGGEPKLLPARVTAAPQPELLGETEFRAGAGTGVGVIVGVLVAEAPHAVIVKARAGEAPPLFVTIRLELSPAGSAGFGSCAVNDEFAPPMSVRINGVPEPLGPPSSCTVVPNADGGVPKLLPVMVTVEPQVPVGVEFEIVGAG